MAQLGKKAAYMTAAELRARPAWLQILLSTYPDKQLMPDTLDIYEDALAGYSSGSLMYATKEVTRTEQWFPTIAKLTSLASALSYHRLETHGMTSVPTPLPAEWILHEPCGEHSPDTTDACPFCLDMAAAISEKGDAPIEVRHILESTGYGSPSEAPM